MILKLHRFPCSKFQQKNTYCIWGVIYSCSLPTFVLDKKQFRQTQILEREILSMPIFSPHLISAKKSLYDINRWRSKFGSSIGQKLVANNGQQQQEEQSFWNRFKSPFHNKNNRKGENNNKKTQKKGFEQEGERGSDSNF